MAGFHGQTSQLSAYLPWFLLYFVHFLRLICLRLVSNKNPLLFFITSLRGPILKQGLNAYQYIFAGLLYNLHSFTIFAQIMMSLWSYVQGVV